MSSSFDSSGSSTSSSSSSGCHLSPAAGAFTAILSAFIGSIINGLTNGWLVAFMTGWIAWLAVFRTLIGGLYMCYHSITDSWGPGRSSSDDDDNSDMLDPGMIPIPTHNPQDGDAESRRFLPTDNGYGQHSFLPAHTGYYGQQDPMYSPIPGRRHEEPNPQASPDPQTPPTVTCTQMAKNIWPPPTLVRHGQGNRPPPNSIPGSSSYSPLTITKTPKTLDRSVTALGWFGLAYTALWAPITQLLFVAANASRGDIGSAKIVKGLTTAITALPLCIDCRVRYGDSLLRWRGARYVFNVVVGVSCLLQGAVCAALLVTGWVDLSRVEEGEEGGLRSMTVPRFVPAVYVLFAVVWMLVSFTILPMRDGGRQGAGKTHWAGYFVDVGVGAFAGVFLAAPALILYFGATAGNMSSGARDLGEYLSCESQVWRKFAAVAP